MERSRPVHTALTRHTPSIRLTRRRLVGASATALGLTGLAATSGGVIGLSRRAALAQDEPDSPALTEPPVRASQNGLLETTLEARPYVEAGPGRLVYEDSMPGPTLKVRPGDTLRVKLINNLGGDTTNLHVHGMHVSPRDNGDNVFVHLMNGESFDYEYAIPANHPAGLYWYHPHYHGDAMQQVMGGLAGAIIVEGGLDEMESIKGLTDRLLVLQGPFTGGGSLSYLVNGQLTPTIVMQPGETQRWRILNASANNFSM